MGAAITLGRLKIAGVGHTGLAQTAAGALALSGPVASMYGRPQYLGKAGVVELITPPILARGGGLFQFSGPPKAGVVWALITGVGDLTPIAPHTDAWGRAYAVYTPGGYTGPLKIGVSYGG